MWLQSRMEIVHDLIVVNGRVRHIFSTPQKPLTKKNWNWNKSHKTKSWSCRACEESETLLSANFSTLNCLDSSLSEPDYSSQLTQ